MFATFQFRERFQTADEAFSFEWMRRRAIATDAHLNYAVTVDLDDHNHSLAFSASVCRQRDKRCEGKAVRLKGERPRPAAEAGRTNRRRTNSSPGGCMEPRSLQNIEQFQSGLGQAAHAPIRVRALILTVS
jgi:hypothetical protein